MVNPNITTETVTIKSLSLRLYELAKEGRLKEANWENVRESTVLKKIEEKKRRLNLLHLAAETGQLKYIPEKFLTEKNLKTLITGNVDRENVFFVAARAGCLDAIPLDILRKNLWKGFPSIYEICSRENTISCIPKILIKEKEEKEKSIASKLGVGIGGKETYLSTWP